MGADEIVGILNGVARTVRVPGHRQQDAEHIGASARLEDTGLGSHALMGRDHPFELTGQSDLPHGLEPLDLEGSNWTWLLPDVVFPAYIHHRVLKGTIKPSEQSPFWGGSVRTVYASHALEFSPPPGRALHELVQLLDNFGETVPGRS